MGDLPIVHKAIVGFSVAMLMTMVIWLLDQMFAPIGFFTKLCYAAGYVFLTLISVGFGFGFYWKVLESRSEASRSAESAVSQVQTSLYAASTRLDQLQATLVQLAKVSTEKAELERAKGTSCPNSRPGDGPRRKMREEDAGRFTFASDFVKGRAGAVKDGMSALDGDLAKITTADASTFDPKTGTRNEFMKGLSRKLDMTVTGFNAFRTDPQLRQLRTELADRAERSTFGDAKSGGFICPDPQLQGALRGAVKAIDQLPELEKPKIAAVEGSEATIEAFRRLTATFFGLLSFKMPPSADELRELQQRAVQSVEGGATAQLRAVSQEAVGLSKRDYVPLGVALFVDLCLLLVSMGRPMNRLGSLVPKMRAAEQGPVIQILSRFNEIHRDPQIRQNFEVFRHVVFDQGGTYYVAVPLDAPYRANPHNPDQRQSYGSNDAEALQHEAHLLSNLFTSFEQERIFKRVYSPLLSTRAVQKKLARQGSKFAGCEAFRVYRFRDGAWSEIILGAVMGAARRAEAGRWRTADTAVHVSEATRPIADAATAGMDNFSSTAAQLPRDERQSPGRSSARWRDPSSVQTGAPPLNTSTSRARAEAAVDPELVAKFGPHARAARHDFDQPETPDRDGLRIHTPANSNTMPSASRPSEGSRAAPVAAEETVSDTVVALPVRQRQAQRPQPEFGGNLARQPLDPEQTEPASSLQRGAAEASIDVVMRRETATFSIPVSEARLPGGLLNRFTGDEHSVALNATNSVATVMLAPATHVDQGRPLQIAEVSGELESIAAEEQDMTEDDVSGIAGRLRPAMPAQ